MISSGPETKVLDTREGLIRQEVRVERTPSEDSGLGNPKATALEVREMFGRIAGRYDILNTVLSGGTHHLWKRQAIALLPERERAVVLDLCTGTGDLLPLLQKKSAQVIG
ncbi:MAG: class I SAM-dependent methyltransferase, partial [Bdellovibrionales bacterium]|nr:class I SAM-dependent methyltransferase [Bdellovibrionales bacterium]